MIPIQTMKTVTLLKPQVKNNGAFVGNGYVDWGAWNHARVLFIVGDTDAAVGSGDATTPPLVEECDTAGGSYTAIPSAELSGVIADDDDNKLFAIDLDLRRTRKRYGRVKAPTAANQTDGASLAILCILSMGQIGPKNASEMGLEELVNA